MSEQTERLALPLLQSGQAQKEVTHNEALHLIDRRLYQRVESATLSSPPDPAEVGKTWIVGAGASGGWSGREKELAEWTGSTWSFTAPLEGMSVWNAGSGVYAFFVAGAWQDILPVAGLSIGGNPLLTAAPTSVADPAGGSVVDLEARATLASLLANFRALGLISV